MKLHYCLNTLNNATINFYHVENRLTSVSSNGTVPVINAYDHQFHRV